MVLSEPYLFCHVPQDCEPEELGFATGGAVSEVVSFKWGTNAMKSIKPEGSCLLILSCYFVWILLLQYTLFCIIKTVYIKYEKESGCASIIKKIK